MNVVLHTLRDHMHYAKFSMYEFLLESVAFLGNIVSKDGITVERMTIEAICDWDRPMSPFSIHIFFLADC